VDVVARICGLPAQFKAHGTVSVLQLVDESGYRANPGSLRLPRMRCPCTCASTPSSSKRGWLTPRISGRRQAGMSSSCPVTSSRSATTRTVNGSRSRVERPHALSLLCVRFARLLANLALQRPACSECRESFAGVRPQRMPRVWPRSR